MLLIWIFYCDRDTLLPNKLLEQGYVNERLKSSLGSYIVDTRILLNNMRFFSHESEVWFIVTPSVHPFQRTELLKITRQGISWRYTEYKLNTYYC